MVFTPPPLGGKSGLAKTPFLIIPPSLLLQPSQDRSVGGGGAERAESCYQDLLSVQTSIRGGAKPTSCPPMVVRGGAAAPAAPPVGAPMLTTLFMQASKAKAGEA